MSAGASVLLPAQVVAKSPDNFVDSGARRNQLLSFAHHATAHSPTPLICRRHVAPPLALGAMSVVGVSNREGA